MEDRPNGGPCFISGKTEPLFIEAVNCYTIQISIRGNPMPLINDFLGDNYNAHWIGTI